LSVSSTNAIEFVQSITLNALTQTGKAHLSNRGVGKCSANERVEREAGESSLERRISWCDILRRGFNRDHTANFHRKSLVATFKCRSLANRSHKLVSESRKICQGIPVQVMARPRTRMPVRKGVSARNNKRCQPQKVSVNHKRCQDPLFRPPGHQTKGSVSNGTKSS